MKVNSSNTILYCTNWQATVAFYRDLLKLSINFSNDWFVEFRLNEGARLSVANEARCTVKSGGGAGITLSLNVDDVQTLRAMLIEARIDVTPIKALWGSSVFYIHDPEGNRIEFWT